MNELELIAERCRRDFTCESAPNTCPNPRVQCRPAPTEPAVGHTAVEMVVAGLNEICRRCPEWDPIREKPEEDIAYSCCLSWKIPPRCPEREVWAPIHQKLDVEPSRLDDICRRCRLFTPFPSVLA